MNGALVGGVLAGVGIAGALFLAGCGHVHGKGFCHGWGGDKADWVVNKISSELDLNDTQKAKLNSLKDEVLKKKDEFKGDHEAMLAEIRTQLLSDKLDQAKINQLFVSRQAKHDEMRQFLIAKVAEFHAVLTPEQRTKLVNKLEAWHKHMQMGCE